MKSVRRPFGRSKSVSLFTLGTMRALDSEEQMYEVVKASLNAGINHLETAPAYGQAEIYLGKALEHLKDEGKEPLGGWVITTKILPTLEEKKIEEQIYNSLSKLKVEKIDNLAIHGLNLDEHLEWALEGKGKNFLNWVENQDLVTQVGFSSHGSFSLIEKALTSNRFQFCSLHLHLMDPEKIPLAKFALEKGMGVMAISPADKGGHLYSPSQVLIEDCYPFEPLELAYRFLITHGISTLTVGAATPEHLKTVEKLNTKDDPLNKEEKETLSKLHQNQTQRLYGTQCGQCKACLPCPEGVPIPNLLRLRNLVIGHELEGFAKERYNLIGKAGHWWETNNANACNKCGDCLPRCPNHLPIPKLLNETHHLLAGPMKRRLWS